MGEMKDRYLTWLRGRNEGQVAHLVRGGNEGQVAHLITWEKWRTGGSLDYVGEMKDM